MAFIGDREGGREGGREREGVCVCVLSGKVARSVASQGCCQSTSGVWTPRESLIMAHHLHKYTRIE